MTHMKERNQYWLSSLCLNQKLKYAKKSEVVNHHGYYNIWSITINLKNSILNFRYIIS